MEGEIEREMEIPNPSELIIKYFTQVDEGTGAENKMETRKQTAGSEVAHILCYSLAVQGHLNPILQFCKRLAYKGLRVTLVSTNSSATRLIQTQASSINIELISDGFKEGERAASTEDYFERHKVFVSQNLAKLIEKLCSSEYPPKFLVYDSVLPWALDIARGFGMDGAPFFTQSWAVNSIYFHFHRERFKIPLEVPTLLLPSIPQLRKEDLPSMFLEGNHADHPYLLKLLVNQFSNIEEPNWLFCNTFHKLEDEVVSWMASQYPIKTIGPTIPSMYLDKRLENDKDYGLSLFKPNTEACLKWLDSKEPGSVLYVSFGSLAAPGEDQMEELAWGLRRSNSYFLWVVRESESRKLPSNFSEETSEKGLVVSWSSQVEVLAHKSVGCFMTHCGWNSTLEALSLGVPMVAMPQWVDQTTNAKYIADVWQVGIRARVNEKGIVAREEIELCIREVMEGERGKVIKRNSKRWKELAKKAVDCGGSSDKNLEEFVARLYAADPVRFFLKTKISNLS